MRGINKLYYIKKDINKIENQIKELTVLKASAISSIPSGGDVSSQVERFVIRVESLQEKLTNKMNEYMDERERIETFIDGIEDREIQSIARMRYIDNMKYQEIGDELYIDRTTVQKKLKRYLDKANCYEQ